LGPDGEAAGVLRLPLARAPLAPDAGAERRALLRRVAWCVAALAGGAAGGVALHGAAARVACALVVAALLAAALVSRRRGALAPAGWIVADGAGVSRERAGAAVRLAPWGGRFGVAVLAGESQGRGLLAFTTSEATRLVPVRARADGDDDAAAARELFARASSIPDAELPSATDDGGDDALSAADALRLLAAIRAREPAAVDRILLSDPRGAPIVLEGHELRAGERVIDLTQPLEWRSFLFLESAGPLAAVVQATWVRQAGVEVVLVAPMHPDATSVSPSAPHASRPRDARWSTSAPDAAPPIELRMAIERLFMAPLRHALDRAPRASRAPAPSSTRTRGVDRRA
jgi:hypothetical protein